MRHKLTLAERIRGLERAVASSATPDALRPALRNQLRTLQHKRNAQGPWRKHKNSPLGWLGL